MIQTYEEVGVYSPRDASLYPVVSQLDVTEKGWVPHLPIGTEHTWWADRLGLPLEATGGGSITIYPEYRESLRQMREEFDRNRLQE